MKCLSPRRVLVLHQASPDSAWPTRTASAQTRGDAEREQNHGSMHCAVYNPVQLAAKQTLSFLPLVPVLRNAVCQSLPPIIHKPTSLAMTRVRSHSPRVAVADLGSSPCERVLYGSKHSPRRASPRAPSPRSAVAELEAFVSSVGRHPARATIIEADRHSPRSAFADIVLELPEGRTSPRAGTVDIAHAQALPAVDRGAPRTTATTNTLVAAEAVQLPPPMQAVATSMGSHAPLSFAAELAHVAVTDRPRSASPVRCSLSATLEPEWTQKEMQHWHAVMSNYVQAMAASAVQWVLRSLLCAWSAEAKSIMRNRQELADAFAITSVVSRLVVFAWRRLVDAAATVSSSSRTARQLVNAAAASNAAAKVELCDAALPFDTSDVQPQDQLNSISDIVDYQLDLTADIIEEVQGLVAQAGVGENVGNNWQDFDCILGALLAERQKACSLAELTLGFRQWVQMVQLQKKGQLALSQRLSLLQQRCLSIAWGEWRCSILVCRQAILPEAPQGVTPVMHSVKPRSELFFASRAQDLLCLSAPFHAWHRALLCAALLHAAKANAARSKKRKKRSARAEAEGPACSPRSRGEAGETACGPRD